MKGMAPRIPGGLAASCHKTPQRTAWLGRLPDVLRDLEHRWSLTLAAPFDDEEVSCSYVAGVVHADGTPAVLKIGMPHMEGEHEIHGLLVTREWKRMCPPQVISLPRNVWEMPEEIQPQLFRH